VLVAAGVAIAVSTTTGPASSGFSAAGAIGRAGHGPAAHGSAGTQAAGKAVVTHSPAPAHHKAPRRVGRPYVFYDSVTPTAIPAHRAVATYATGNYAASPADVAGRRTVLWIDTTGTDYKASALDIEPGDATPPVAANWARQRLSAYPHAVARLYTMQSEWPAVKAAVAALPAWMHSHIRYWIADPTGVPHMVPGSQATQWYWGSSYDISTAAPNF